MDFNLNYGEVVRYLAGVNKKPVFPILPKHQNSILYTNTRLSLMKD